MSADEEEIFFLSFRLRVTDSLIMAYQLRIEVGCYIIITFSVYGVPAGPISLTSSRVTLVTSLQLEIFRFEHHLTVSRELL